MNNPISNLLDYLLDRTVYKGAVGEIIWDPEEHNDTREADASILIRTASGIQELPFHIANRCLVRRPTHGMFMQVHSQAILEGMVPVGFRYGSKLFSPYSPVPLKEEQLWPRMSQVA